MTADVTMTKNAVWFGSSPKAAPGFWTWVKWSTPGITGIDSKGAKLFNTQAFVSRSSAKMTAAATNISAKAYAPFGKSAAGSRGAPELQIGGATEPQNY